ncbi:MAG: YdcF family protein [Cytophagaceae bacterium]|nr:YdcF family protein [Cytophagaceae bacterium]
MFFILSKTLDVLLLPYTWIVVAACCALLLKDKRKKKKASIVLLVLLIITGNSAFVNYLFQKWEMPPQALNTIPAKCTAIILTGVTKLNKKPYDRVFFAKGADRVTQALMLYRKGKIKHIIITGGSGKLLKEGRPEALELKRFLLDCQIPADIISIEDKALNTHQNAVLTKALINKEGLQGPFILITSAFHMNRAFDCFKKEKIECIPFPVDYYSMDEIDNPLEYVIPEVSPLNNFTILVRELSGYGIYKAMGYL